MSRKGTLFLTISLLSANAAFAEPAAVNGKQTYEKTCSSCHEGGMKGFFTGAPETGEFDEWAPFFKKGIDQMSKNVVTGDKKHEKKGGCETCSTESIRAAISYILSNTPETH